MHLCGTWRRCTACPACMLVDLQDLCLPCLQLPAQEDVEFWHKPEKMGWLQSQGEHLRTWRRRWFVLKQGFLFRFGDQNVVASSKPRGIVDLSKVTDVSSGRDTTGKPNSITLSTATGAVSVADMHRISAALVCCPSLALHQQRQCRCC